MTPGTPVLLGMADGRKSVLLILGILILLVLVLVLILLVLALIFVLVLVLAVVLLILILIVHCVHRFLPNIFRMIPGKNHRLVRQTAKGTVEVCRK